ncbi:hypothetical protein NUW54_g11434 [Trametes sanguinea]|uniref:Uncharacterized protein n=1 Tax=Trametes sanguinea TaxID=158606 RepID=A0ACC1NFN1_9APHY|nr:hypothetical protein NUW54_g11434 [Trametes sanguinea]
MKLFCFNTAINPYEGLFDITAEDTDSADDVLCKIWDRFRERLQDQWPKVARPDLELVRLTEPVLMRPVATLPDRLSQYGNEKKEPVEPWQAINELPCASELGCLSFEVRVVGPAVRSTAKAATIVQRNNLSTVEDVLSPPSKVAASITDFKCEQDSHILYNGRPADRSAAPIAIYQPVFARLKESLSKINRGESLSELYRDLVPRTSQLFQAACQIYDSDVLREDAVMGHLGNILNVRWDSESHLHINCTGISGAVALVDGVARVETGRHDYYQLEQPMYAYAEIKNELGVDGMCEVQVAATYQWAIALLEYTSIREASCFPCILVSIAGPYIRFYGAVLTDAFIVQPFVDFIFLGGDPDAEERIERVAKIFVEVRRALEELKVWYQGLSIGGGDDRTHCCPRSSS